MTFMIVCLCICTKEVSIAKKIQLLITSHAGSSDQVNILGNRQHTEVFLFPGCYSLYFAVIDPLSLSHLYPRKKRFIFF